MQNIESIRNKFKILFTNNKFVNDRTGGKSIELVGESFIADSPSIFGTVNYEYIDRELAWYDSQSLNVNDIPGKTPAIWENVSTVDGLINSNYGWCIYSDENYNQYDNCLAQLKSDKNTRRAIMIYTRPKIQLEYNLNGCNDFICTNTVHYFIRDNVLIGIVQMRSNDVFYGYRNDYAWQKHVIDKLASDLSITDTKLIWQANSLHLYDHCFKHLA